MKKLKKEDAIKLIKKLNETGSDFESKKFYKEYLNVWFIRCIAKLMYTKSEINELAKIIDKLETTYKNNEFGAL